MTGTPKSPNQPRVGITIGDPAGIGPEIVLKAAVNAQLRSACRMIIVADAKELRRQAGAFGLPCDYPVIGDSAGIETAGESPVIVDVGDVCGSVEYGAVSAAAGRAAAGFIETAVRLCLDKKLDAMATAPINKEALKLAGLPFPGHTEMLAALCGAGRSLMAFFAGDVRVVLLTIHLSLAEAIRAITRARVNETIELTHAEMRRFGLASPRIAVCGLNPHAGEHGLFGGEEIREINPAVADCRARGIDVSGAYPADTIFVRAARGEFDVVIACYHDQGLVAAKCLAFGEAVNVTLGLPIIRTSVDHGTAFDIAGRGLAEAGSMVCAIRLAAKLYQASSATEP